MSNNIAAVITAVLTDVTLTLLFFVLFSDGICQRAACELQLHCCHYCQLRLRGGRPQSCHVTD